MRRHHRPAGSYPHRHCACQHHRPAVSSNKAEMGDDVGYDVVQVGGQAGPGTGPRAAGRPYGLVKCPRTIVNLNSAQAGKHAPDPDYSVGLGGSWRSV